jgi:diaminohydroxyphosphoribosylaminopyrimidine deaminase/5-amino-6-(5-phosphoribosylamino)uracil reductase
MRGGGTGTQETRDTGPSEFDRAMMRRALFHAARGAGRTAPNPMVGAVVVSREGVVVGQGWHRQAGEAHAELHALEEAGGRARAGTLYVTLEPCCHVGRTGPCTRRIVAAGVARVVAAMRDPDPRVDGSGFAELRAHGVRVEEGCSAAEARRLNAAFVTLVREGRPFVVLKAATSLDARVAERPGARTPLTSPEANRKTQLLRAGVDAIAVGSGTLLADDPWLTVRDCHRVRPFARVVFDRRLRTSPGARVFSTLSAGPVIMVTDARAPAGPARLLEEAGASVVRAESLGDALRRLVAFDISSLLVEGGPTLQAALVREGLVDRLHLVVAPQALGPEGVPWIDAECLAPSALTCVAVEPRGGDVWIEADVQRHR